MDKITQSLTPLELVSALNKTIEKVNCIQSHYLGDLVFSYSEEPQAGRVRLDGAEYAADLFLGFYQLLETGKLKTISYAEWDRRFLAQQGNVEIIAIDKVNRKFKMPRVDSSTMIGQALIGQAGSFVAAGLPNAKGDFEINSGYELPTSGIITKSQKIYLNNIPIGPGQGNFKTVYGIDLSKESAIYRDDVDTVTPRHIRYPLYMVVANAAVPVSVAQYNQFVSALELKMNADFSNATRPYILESWVNPNKNEGYEIMSNGKIIQWGYFIPTVNDVLITVNFYVPFKNIPCVFPSFNYGVGGAASYQYFCPRNVSKTCFQLMQSTSPGVIKSDWFAVGY